MHPKVMIGSIAVWGKNFIASCFSAEIFLSDQFQIKAGLNMLRRQSLNAYNFTSGLNGFNIGFSVLFNQLQIRYGTGFYQQNLYHQFSLNFNLKGNSLR